MKATGASGEFIDRVADKLTGRMPRKRAVAAAMNIARRSGFDVPERHTEDKMTLFNRAFSEASETKPQDQKNLGKHFDSAPDSWSRGVLGRNLGRTGDIHSEGHPKSGESFRSVKDQVGKLNRMQGKRDPETKSHVIPAANRSANIGGKASRLTNTAKRERSYRIDDAKWKAKDSETGDAHAGGHPKSGDTFRQIDLNASKLKNSRSVDKTDPKAHLPKPAHTRWGDYDSDVKVPGRTPDASDFEKAANNAKWALGKHSTADMKKGTAAIKSEIGSRSAREQRQKAREGSPHPVDVAGKRKRPYEVFHKAKSDANLTMDVAKDAVRQSHQDHDTYKAYSNLPSVKHASWVQNQSSPFAHKAKRVKMKPGMATENTTSLADRLFGEALNPNDAAAKLGKIRMLGKFGDKSAHASKEAPTKTSVQSGNKAWMNQQKTQKTEAMQTKLTTGLDFGKRVQPQAQPKKPASDMPYFGSPARGNIQKKVSESELTEAKAKLGSGARFKSLKKKLSHKGAKHPGALAAWIGRKKFGKAKFGKLAAHGKHTYTESADAQTAKINALAESLLDLRKSITGK